MRYLYLSVVMFFIANCASAQFLFKDITTQTGIYMRCTGAGEAGAGVVILDLNGDGWDDIYMPGGLDSDKLYINMHDGTFRDVTPANISNHTDRTNTSWRSFPRGGIAFDFDNDGLPDIYSACENNDILWHNNGNY